MTYEESVSYFKLLENLEKIRCTNRPNHSSLPVDNKKSVLVSVTSSIGKSSKNPKGFNIWCHSCDKNNHNTADYRAITKFKQLKKAHFEAKAILGKKSLALLFKEINALKSQLKLEKTTSKKKKNKESLISSEINLTTSSDEDTGDEYLFSSSKPLSSSKTKIAKSSHPTIND
jgi:hypothetical protein